MPTATVVEMARQQLPRPSLICWPRVSLALKSNRLASNVSPLEQRISKDESAAKIVGISGDFEKKYREPMRQYVANKSSVL